MGLKKQISSGVSKLKLYWKTPPKGRYMSFKEIASLSIGGMGVKFICYPVQLMILSVGNTLIGNTIGIAPQPMYVIYLLSVICSFPLTALRAKIVDGAHNKKGKYRPYVLMMGIPTVILGLGFTWMPYDRMDMLQKCVVVLLFNIGFQFFYMFMFDAYDSILNVLSPNTYERSDVCSIKSVTDSFAPTIIGIALPLLARLITGENVIYDMKIYRIIYPPILIVGLLLTIFIYTNTEEKIVQAKTHTVKIKFSDAFRAVARNKYFWIISLAGWLGFLETSFGSILGWLYNYQAACSAGQYSLVTAIYGNSSLWSMLFAPLLIRKVGKRNLLIYSNIMSIGFILLMYPVIKYSPANVMIWLLLAVMFINGLGTSLGNILAHSVNGDIRDYQHYISGERIDGMFVAVGLIGSVVSLLTSGVLPTIYDKVGLNKSVAISLGYSGNNVYEVLYDTGYFHSISLVLIIASAIGALLNAIPYFFYDLTETKQKAMVTVLKIRALFEDYGNNALSDKALVEAIDIIEDANECCDGSPIALTHDEIKAAKKTKDKEKIKAAKKKYNSDKAYNEKIEISQFVVNEINKFDTPEVKADVERAHLIVGAGLEGLYETTTLTKAEAKSLPHGTKDEKALRNSAKDKARAEIHSKKVIKKYYPEGLIEFDNSVFDKLFKAEDETEAELKGLYTEKETAKDSGDKAAVKRISDEIAALKKTRAEVKAETKKAENQYSIFNRAAKPYLDSKKLLIQQENYRHYEDIKERYEESKLRSEEEDRIKAEAEAKEKAEKEAYEARLKAEKQIHKSKK